MPHLTRTFFGLLVASLAVASTGEAQSRSTAARLSELRAQLYAYDAESTPSVIEALGPLALDASSPLASEARFLRTIATVDLSLIARRRYDTALLERVAAAYGTTPSGLDGALRADLQALRHEPYLASVEDALTALAPRAPRSLPAADGEHTRARAVYFAEVFDALLGADDPVRALARFGVDPCAAEAPCEAPYVSFGPEGRRAIAAMSALHALLGSVERTARLGDPFSAALAREVLVDAVVLRAITLRPRDWARSIHAVPGVQHSEAVDVDAVVVVGPDRVRAGWVPEVLFDAAGRPSSIADGPLLGSALAASVSFAPAADDSLRPVPELAAHVARGIGGAARVAVMVEPGVEAHHLSRVLVSLQHASLPFDVLAVAAEDGTARGVAFETVEDDVGPVGVFVRLGGFSAWQPGERVSLPRRRVEARWEFDFDGLERATRERTRHPVTLRFMSTVSADLVLRVALSLASVNRPLRLVVPRPLSPRNES